MSNPEADPISRRTGVRPSKVIAVHLNYASRAAQRGRTPAFGSYFLKPPSSLTGSGSTVLRPAGTELLGYEGEIALIIGTPAFRVGVERAWSHVGWVTAANDLGLHDLRHADRGSNLRSKGGDGFTPVGPELLDARTVDPGGLRLRTWCDGALVQSDDTSTLLFSFAELVADLSRLSTLERGDLILTGTPAGAGVAEPGSVIEVEVDSVDPSVSVSTGRLRTTVGTGPALAPLGAPPQVDAATRADAVGIAPSAPAPSADPDLLERLSGVSVATLSAVLRKRGLDSTIDGVHPSRAGTRFTGRARTLRYLPHRGDLADAHGSGFTAQKRAVDTVGPGDVLVMEARGERGTGTIGDILALRAQVRGAAAVVTDGGVRDSAAVAALELPVFHAGAHPAVLGRRHVPWETDVAIGCGGTTVVPGDLLAGDDDGVVVIPADLVEDVLGEAIEQERQERFITEQVAAGAPVDGLYPLAGPWRERYRRWSGP